MGASGKGEGDVGVVTGAPAGSEQSARWGTSQHPASRAVLPSVFDISHLYNIRYHFFHEGIEKDTTSVRRNAADTTI